MRSNGTNQNENTVRDTLKNSPDQIWDVFNLSDDANAQILSNMLLDPATAPSRAFPLLHTLIDHAKDDSQKQTLQHFLTQNNFKNLNIVSNLIFRMSEAKQPTEACLKLCNLLYNTVKAANLTYTNTHIETIVNLSAVFTPEERNELRCPYNESISLVDYSLYLEDGKLTSKMLAQGFQLTFKDGKNVSLAILNKRYEILKQFSEGLEDLLEQIKEAKIFTVSTLNQFFHGYENIEDFFGKEIVQSIQQEFNKNINLYADDLDQNIRRENLRSFFSKHVQKIKNHFLHYNEVATLLQHPLFDPTGSLKFKNPASGNDIEINTKSLSNIKYAGGGAFGYVFACKYDESNQEFKRFCRTLTDENNQPVLDKDGKESNWFVVKIPRPDHEFIIQDEQQADFDKEWHFVDGLGPELAKVSSVGTNNQAESGINLSQAAEMKCDGKEPMKCIISQFENYHTLVEKGKITPVASDAKTFLTEIKNPQSTEKYAQDLRANFAINLIGMMASAKKSIDDLHHLDGVHLDVALRNFLMGKIKYNAEGQAIGVQTKLADFGYSIFLNGQKNIDEQRSVAPLRSLNQKRIYNMVHHNNNDPDYPAEGASKEADLFADRIMFYNAIAIDLNIDERYLISPKQNFCATGQDAFMFVMNEGDDIALKQYYDNAFYQLNVKLNSNPSPIQITELLKTKAYLEAFEKYLSTPTKTPKEDEQLFASCVQQYFMKTVISELNDHQASQNTPKLKNAIESLLSYSLNFDGNNSIFANCKKVAASTDVKTAKENIQELYGAVKDLYLTDTLENIKALENRYNDYLNRLESISKNPESKINDFINFQPSDAFAIELQNIQNQIKNWSEDIKNIPGFKELEISLNQLQEKMNDKQHWTEFLKVKEDKVEAAAKNIILTINPQFRKYNDLRNKAEEKNLSPVELAEAITLTKSIKELYNLYGTLSQPSELRITPEVTRDKLDDIINGKYLTDKVWIQASKMKSLAPVWKQHLKDIEDIRTDNFIIGKDPARFLNEYLQKLEKEFPLPENLNRYLAKFDTSAKLDFEKAKRTIEALGVINVAKMQLEKNLRISKLSSDQLLALVKLREGQLGTHAQAFLDIALKAETKRETFNYILRTLIPFKPVPETSEERKKRLVFYTAQSNEIALNEKAFTEELAIDMTSIIEKKNALLKSGQLDQEDILLLDFYLAPYQQLVQGKLKQENDPEKDIGHIAEYYNSETYHAALTQAAKYQEVFREFAKDKNLPINTLPKITEYAEYLKGKLGDLKIKMPLGTIKTEMDNAYSQVKAANELTAFAVNYKTTHKILRSHASAIRKQQNQQIETILKDGKLFDHIRQLNLSDLEAGEKFKNVIDRMLNYGLKQDKSTMGIKRASYVLDFAREIQEAKNIAELNALLIKERSEWRVHRNPLLNKIMQTLNINTTLMTLLTKAKNTLIKPVVVEREEIKEKSKQPLADNKPEASSKLAAPAHVNSTELPLVPPSSTEENGKVSAKMDELINDLNLLAGNKEGSYSPKPLSAEEGDKVIEQLDELINDLEILAQKVSAINTSKNKVR